LETEETDESVKKLSILAEIGSARLKMALKRAAVVDPLGLLPDDADLDWAKSHDIYNTYFKTTLPVGKWVGLVRKDRVTISAQMPASVSALDMSVTNEKDFIGVVADTQNDICMYVSGLVPPLKPKPPLYLTHVGHETEDGAERKEVKRRAVGTVGPGILLGAPAAFRAPATWSGPGVAPIPSNPFYDSLEDGGTITYAQAVAINGNRAVGVINGASMADAS